jgi:hypothetical protein
MRWTVALGKSKASMSSASDMGLPWSAKVERRRKLRAVDDAVGKVVVFANDIVVFL